MIYFDNAATTKMDRRLLEVIAEYSCDNFYNPSAAYRQGFEVLNVINKSKKQILSALNATNNDNIVFTGSATEANNLAILGGVSKRFKKVLISAGEHSSSHRVSQILSEQGFIVEYINLDNDGKLSIEDLKNKLTSDVGFVSFIHVSNETGAINDAKEICRLVKQVNSKAIVHCDGVQAFSKININLSSLGVDLYTISGHKVHGPKGVAGLYIKQGVNLKPIIHGGGQQGGIRSGTENIPSIVAFAEVTKYFNIDENYKYVQSLKDRLVELLSINDKIIVNSNNECSPYIVSLTLKGVNGETIVHILEDKEILISTGSACSSHSKGNRILEQMGIKSSEIKGSIRVSFSNENTVDEVEIFAKTLLEEYESLYKKVNRC